MDNGAVELLFGFGLGILAATLSYLAGRLGIRRATHQDAPGTTITPATKAEVDALAAKVRALSLEWEDTNDRLLRKVRALRAASRSAPANGEEPEEDSEPAPTIANSRAAVLAAYRRKVNASRQS